MKVRNIMTPDPEACAPETTLAAAASQMWKADCGFLPVVAGGKLVGVVTDRDMYIALATRNRLASDLIVGEVATAAVVSCSPDDDVHAVLATMKRAMVRRLPVVAPDGTVVGIISTDDLLRVAGPRKTVRSDEIVETLQAIIGHHDPVRRIAAV